jgi:hypothetical protein
MSAKAEQSPPTAPKWQRMPSRLRVELEAAVFEHLQVHGARHYELLREDRRFAAWTGAHLGHRGEKYFDRVVADVKEAKARKARLKRRYLASAEAPTAHPLDLGAEGGVNAAYTAAAGSVGFPDLLRDLCEQRRTIKAEQAACLDDDGCLDASDRYFKAARELRDVDKAIADLSKQYGALKSGEGADELFRMLHQEFADQPGRVAAVMANFRNFIRHQSGLAAQSGASQ